jgi:hypothetical protein
MAMHHFTARVHGISIIKIEFNTKKTIFERKKIAIKLMIRHSLSMYKIRGKTKIKIDTSIED